MDDKSVENIRLYDSCDDLPMYNFNKIREEESFNYLVWGYNGYSKINLPTDYFEVWKKILFQYENLTKNNQLFSYYELIMDIQESETRIELANALLYQLELRPNMPSNTQKKYIEELQYWRFYINTSKSLPEELKAKKRQLDAARMKLSQKKKEKTRIEESNKDNTPFLKIKTRIDMQLPHRINLREITVTEWVYLIEELSNRKTVK